MGEYIRDDNGSIYTARDYLEFKTYSAHALITPDGIVIRCRDDDQGAHHARGHNRHTLGIEYLVPGIHNYGTFKKAIKNEYLSYEQWTAGLEVIRGWCSAHDIGRENVVRHSDVDPARKIDPGDGFPFDNLLNELSK